MGRVNLPIGGQNLLSKHGDVVPSLSNCIQSVDAIPWSSYKVGQCFSHHSILDGRCILTSALTSSMAGFAKELDIDMVDSQHMVVNGIGSTNYNLSVE
jgi:hypothetical protein